MLQLWGVGWRSPDCIIVVIVLVEWLYYSKRIIFVRWADLSDFFR